MPAQGRNAGDQALRGTAGLANAALNGLRVPGGFL